MYDLLFECSEFDCESVSEVSVSSSENEFEVEPVKLILKKNGGKEGHVHCRPKKLPFMISAKSLNNLSNYIKLKTPYF